MPNPVSGRSDATHVVRLGLEGMRGVVDGRGLDFGLAEREAQLWQVGDLVRLPPRRFEEDGRTDTPVDVLQRTCRVGIERPCVRLGARDVGVNARHEPRLAELP